MTAVPSSVAETLPPPARVSIELRGLSKRYGLETVVDRVSATIGSGEFFSLLGPSGSGKTTTLMMVAGFASADDGMILLDGADVARLPPQKRGFGMVFQNYAIFPHLNVFDNVAFPLRVRRLPREEIRKRVGWALDMVRLGPYGTRFAKQLSGGQQQRVALARAIVFHPRVVLMDEPLGALDKNLRYQMQTEIKDIQAQLGMTVVYVTHDQEEAMNMSDRLAIMNGGRIQQVGSPTSVYDAPATAFVARFLGHANLLPGRVAGSEGGVVCLEAQAGGVLRGLPSAGLATEAGASCLLFVRPERARLAPAGAGVPSPSENRIDGTLRRVSFLGHVKRHVVATAGGLNITVDVTNDGRTGPLEPGAAVTVTWPASDSIVLGSEP